MDQSLITSWMPDLMYTGGQFVGGASLSCDDSGQISGLSEPSGNTISLKNRAVLPGLVNAHSHAFQRVIRARTEHRTEQGADSFWTWRDLMYRAANKLTPEDIYDASRMAFLEMALSGITCVGEFHYLHHAADGTSFDDPNLLSKQVVQAARDVGLKIALLRVAYFRSGFELDPNPQQARFIEKDVETYLEHTTRLQDDLDGVNAWVGLAPHSVRAVPLEHLRAIFSFGAERRLPVHMHVAEQLAEVFACIMEHDRTPVALLEDECLLSDRFTAVHAIHVSEKEVAALAKANCYVCACPTTERNLGDGVIPADQYFKSLVPVALGSDSQAQIDLLEDARELEYHLRMEKKERAVLVRYDTGPSALAGRLFQSATINGAESLGAKSGWVEVGRPADFFTVDLNDPSLAGLDPENLLAGIVFSLNRSAIRDVVVGGKAIVTDGVHVDQEEIVERFVALQKKLWS